jgi:structural maintenance of chromosome 4
MKPNLDSIMLYKNKLIDLRSKENDFDTTKERLQKSKDIFDKIKERRHTEFIEGYNLISSKLKEMYQVRFKFFKIIE